MAEEISLSLEETNRLRISIGLAPIPVEDAGVKKSGKLHKAEEESSAKTTQSLQLGAAISENGPANRDQIQDPGSSGEGNSTFDLKRRIEEANDRAAKRRQAPKPLMYEEEEKPMDDWLAGLGKPKAKAPVKKQKIAKKPQEAADIKIGHSLKELGTIEGDEIFTLQDTNLLDDENDQLQNDRLFQKAKLDKELAEAAEVEKIKYNGRQYRPQDDDQEESTNDFAEDVILTGNTITLPALTDTSSKEPASNLQIASLFDEDEGNSTSDYTKKKPLKMKKVKKKTLSRRILQEDETDLPLQAVPLESVGADEFAAEDEELLKLIASKRRLKQQKRKTLTPEQIAAEIKLNKHWESTNEIESQTNQHITFDDTAGFLENLDSAILERSAGRSIKSEENISDFIKSEEPAATEVEKEGLLNQVKEEPLSDHIKQEIKEEEDSGLFPAPTEEESSTPVFNQGISSTLKFLQSRNIIGTVSEEQKEQSRIQRQAKRDAELLSLKISIEERFVRENLATDKTFMALPRDEREQVVSEHLDHRLREQGLVDENVVANGSRNRRLKRVPDKLANFKPEVKLIYRDDSGRELNTKEAFKHLSHLFHGLGPGRAKVEKRLRREKEEQKNGQTVHDVL